MSDFAREVVPETAATRPPAAIAMMVSNAAMGVPIIILGASIGSDYGTPLAWIVIAAGCAITTALAALAAHAGVISRKSTALLANQTFGQSGALLLNLAIAVALLGWFSVEMGFVGAMVADGLNNVFGIVVGRWPGIVAASVLICTICVFGIALVSRAPMLFLPFLSLLLLVVLILTLRMPVLPPTGIATTKPIGTGISAIVGAYIVGCLIMPDYTRFVRTSRAAVGATIVALGPVYGVMLGTYALAGLATHSTNPSTILLRLGLPTMIGLLLPIGLMQNGIMCLYSSSLATATLARSLSLKITTIALAVVGTALALAGADNFFVSFLVALGIVFPPAVALLIYAALFDEPRLAAQSKAWKRGEIAVWGFGMGCGASTEWFSLSVTGLSAFDGFLFATVGMTILHVARRYSGRITFAQVPTGRQSEMSDSVNHEADRSVGKG